MLYRSDSYISHHENNGRRFPHNMQNNTKLDSLEKRRAENINIFRLKIARIQAEIQAENGPRLCKVAVFCKHGVEL
jgi:hypothetical protein